MRWRISINGIVQGVGFRPTVYRYAKEHSLTGYVLNSSQGVIIEIQGSEHELEKFSDQLQKKPPQASKIEIFHITAIDEIEDEKEFIIQYSQSDESEKTAGISPDITTCPDCLAEISDPQNRRFGYPFTNCTNCGPRFTIIEDRPYDRPLTTMKEFEMCPQCREEYENPSDRRFHAQPNACPLCGPSLLLKTTAEEFLQDKYNLLKMTADFIQKGQIGAIKGLGGFHFACDPFNRLTVQRLREKKNRPQKAFALMAKDLVTVRQYCQISQEEEKILQSSIAPIVLLRKKNQDLDHISPDNNYLGIMLPFTPLHHLLMAKIPLLLMTSGNKRDEPLAIDDEEVKSFLFEGYIDFYLTNNRKIAHRCDDSIVQISSSEVQILRRSRGYVPLPIYTGMEIEKPNLSLGSNMKNTFALGDGNQVFLSQHMGDLTDYRNFDFQKSQIDDLSKLLAIKPEEIYCDAHEGYENYVKEANHVYHHHAHMLSVMAENQLSKGPYTGIICDGTGLGTDNSIWGFEFLSMDQDKIGFLRTAHLQEFVLPGGEKAITEIDRIGISLCKGDWDLPFEQKRIHEIRKLMEIHINCPETSSLGRLFDGITALCGITHRAEYEARGAILLQREAEKFHGSDSEKYSTSLEVCCGESIIIGYEMMIKELLSDLSQKMSTPQIAWKFHRWVTDSILSVLEHLPQNPLLLSGGCFQNQLLTSMIEKELLEKNYTYYMNRQVPPNDGGISLGQSYFSKE